MTIRNYTGLFGTPSVTPQSVPLAGSNQVQNNAGGYVFEVSDLDRLERFLILGTEGGTYYVSEKKLTLESAKHVEKLAKDAKLGPQAVKLIVEISEAGRAPKNDPAIFALAVCMKSGTEKVRMLAQMAVPKVCRTGTHLFQLAESVKALGGWGRGTKRALTSWYTTQSLDELAYQIVKYQSREGWSHRDVLRKLHINPGGTNTKLSRLLRYAVGKGTEKNVNYLPDVVQGFEEIKGVKDSKTAVKLIEKYGLPRECVPTELLNDVGVWNTLLTSGKGMPVTAMVRNLGKMSAIGLLSGMNDATRFVIQRLSDEAAIKGSRIHPMQILMALRTYTSGHGFKGSLTWNVSQQIADALDDAFYGSFKHVNPTGKRHYLGLDISGSMDSPFSAGLNLTCMEAALAMALVTMNVEKDTRVVGFDTGVKELPISRKDRLDQALRKLSGFRNGGGTDCSKSYQDALQRKEKYDAFFVYTDNETWAGHQHPVQALREYRKRMGINAKSCVVGMASTGFTIADPNDPGMLDVVGFDTATPSLMAEFVRK